MINTISAYRRLFASLLAVWMTMIVISGIVFMHKEVTSKGEIITHIHPYDFTDKTKKHHHKNDAEIHLLNVVFQGSFIQSDFTTYTEPFFQVFVQSENIDIVEYYHSTTLTYSFLRGPPQFS